MKVEIDDEQIKSKIRELIRETITKESLRSLIQSRLDRVLTDEIDYIIRYRAETIYKNYEEQLRKVELNKRKKREKKYEHK